MKVKKSFELISDIKLRGILSVIIGSLFAVDWLSKLTGSGHAIKKHVKTISKLSGTLNIWIVIIAVVAIIATIMLIVRLIQSSATSCYEWATLPFIIMLIISYISYNATGNVSTMLCLGVWGSSVSAFWWVIKLINWTNSWIHIKSTDDPIDIAKLTFVWGVIVIIASKLL